MKNFLLKAPKQKFIIPTIKPSSFSLNGNEFDSDASEIIKNEEKNMNFEIEKIQNEFDEEDYSQSSQDIPEAKPNNTIFKTLILIKKRHSSSSSIETRDSDNLE